MWQQYKQQAPTEAKFQAARSRWKLPRWGAGGGWVQCSLSPMGHSRHCWQAGISDGVGEERTAGCRDSGNTGFFWKLLLELMPHVHEAESHQHKAQSPQEGPVSKLAFCVGPDVQHFNPLL